ncbi:MAG TPA: hypothetical protein VKU90_06765 [Caulobacteraceae bacterium]|nr:hypothetical protein [Caulobacteraceae bacterium]
MPAPSTERLDAMLAAALGGGVRVASTELLAPWQVMRCRLFGRGPESVVAKWRRETGVAHGMDPRTAADRTDPSRVATERAALVFLEEIGFARAPRLVAADDHTLILEDLAPRRPLADQMRERGASALAAQLSAFARASGELGAAAARQANRFGEICAGLGVRGPIGRPLGLGPFWPEARAQLEALGRPLSAASERDLAAITAVLARPGPFLTLENGDPHPNNFLCAEEDDGRLIDFEAAGYRHALVSAVWIHVPGPAWITAAAGMAASLEDAYRHALAVGVPEAEDDAQFGFGLAAAALAEACGRIGRFGVVDARPAGDGSRPQRIATLEAAAGVARRAGVLADLAGWMEQTAAWLRRRWPDADLALAELGPYAPRP